VEEFTGAQQDQFSELIQHAVVACRSS